MVKAARVRRKLKKLENRIQRERERERPALTAITRSPLGAEEVALIAMACGQRVPTFVLCPTTFQAPGKVKRG